MLTEGERGHGTISTEGQDHGAARQEQAKGKIMRLTDIHRATTAKLELMLAQCTERDQHQPTYRNSVILSAVGDELAARRGGSESLAAASISERPYYAVEHAEEIARYAHESGIPFCQECKDWHYSEDEHSS